MLPPHIGSPVARLLPFVRSNPLFHSLLVGVLTQAILVFTGVFVARVLGVESRGKLAVVMLVPLVFAQLGALGVPAALTYELSHHRDQRPRVARSALRLLVAEALPLTVLLTVALVPLSSAFGLTGDVIVVAVFGVLSSLTQQYGLAILQGLQLFGSFNLSRLAQPVFYAIAVAVLMVSHTGTVASILAAWIFGSLAVGILTLSHAMRQLPEDQSSPCVDTGKLLRFGSRSMLGTVGPLEAFRIDQFAVAFLLSAEALGLYVVALSLTNLTRFIGQSIGMIAYPIVAGQPTPKAAVGAQRRYVAVAVVAAGLVSLAVGAAAAWLVPTAFGTEFSGATAITYWLLLGSFAAAVRRVMADTARGRGNPSLGSIGEVLGLVILIVCIFAFVGSGAVGIAAGVAVASVLSAVFTSVLALSGGPGTTDLPQAPEDIDLSALSQIELTAE